MESDQRTQVHSMLSDMYAVRVANNGFGYGHSYGMQDVKYQYDPDADDYRVPDVKYEWESKNPMFGEDWDDYFKKTYGADNVEWVSGSNDVLNLNKLNVNKIPNGWSKTEHNGFTHIKDANGIIRIRIDPPDNTTDYYHKHLYDSDGNSLDINGNIVSSKSPDAHIPME